MNNIQFRKPTGVDYMALQPNERQALMGTQGYPAERNRFVTETDISRSLDAVLTDGENVLLDQHGSLLYA